MIVVMLIQNLMEADVTELFSSFQLGGMKLANRIVMAPMTRSRVTPADALGPLNATYYAQRASAGVIISEAMAVSPGARGYLLTPGLYSTEQVEGCTQVVDAVHKAGGRIFAQLWHVGRVAHHSVLPAGAQPLGPTSEPVEDLYVFGIQEDGTPGKVHVSPPRAMSDGDIAETIGQFATAARNAKRAGFDGVEILAANGYVFEQFLNSVVNTRSGAYGGGDPTSRCRLLLDTIDAIRAEIGNEFVLGVRLSPFGTFNKTPNDPETRQTFLHLARQLSERGVDYVHFNDEPVSIGHLNEDAVTNAGAGEIGTKRMIPDDFLAQFRKLYTGTVIACGALTAQRASEMLEAGIADLFAFGTPYIANPDLPERLRIEETLSEPRTAMFYGGGVEGFTDYPRLGGHDANDRQAVLAAAHRLNDAFSTHDVEGYFSGFTGDASFIFYYSKKPLMSRREYRKVFEQWEKEDNFKVLECRSLNQQVQFLSADIALFLHDVETDVDYQGERSTRYERETIVFRREPLGWLAVHEHLSLHNDEMRA